MALVRPQKSSKSRLLQQQTPTLEVTMEQQILLEIQKVSAGQDNLKGQVRDLRMSLMGSGDDGETEHGRLPMAESEIKELREYIKTLEARVKVLEDAHVRYGVYGRFITAGSAFAAGLIGYFVEAVAHSIFGSSKQ